MISVWLRVIRIRFLLSSVIAVSVGLALSWWNTQQFDIIYAMLTMGGVVSLHASVDLLNDYWDFKRGIDLQTQRTKMSGGTGVLPDGLLDPNHVYRVGIFFLVVGAIIGLYFVLTNGLIIAAILAFAIVSIYFYSTKIVDSGLAEVFVTIKGIMIVLGTYYIQTLEINLSIICAGIFVGVLSSLVLFITSLPDFEADKDKGRKTLVIMIGKHNAFTMFLIFPIISYSALIYGIVEEFFPIQSLITLTAIPLLIKAEFELRTNFNNNEKIVSIMRKTILFSRITGALFVLSFLVHL